MLSLLTLLLLTLLLLYSWAEPNGPSSPHLHLSLPGVLPTWTTWSWLQCVAATHGTLSLPFTSLPSFMAHYPWSYSSYSLRTKDNPGQKLRLEVPITLRMRDHLHGHYQCGYFKCN